MQIDIHKNDSERMIAAYSYLLKLADGTDKAHLRTVMTNAKNGISIIVTGLRFGRTRQQERYYRKWCAEFARHCGYYPDEMHEILLRRAYGTDVFSGRFGEVLRPRLRSGDTKRDEYSFLIDTLIQTAADEGFAIPPPQHEMEHENGKENH